MKEPARHVHEPIIAQGQAPKVAQSANRALYDPAAAVPAQLTSILIGGPLVLGSGGDDRPPSVPDQQSPGGMAVIAPVRNQPVRPLPRPPRPVRVCHGDRVERGFEEPDFYWRRRVPGLLPTGYRRHRPVPSTLCPFPPWLVRLWTLFSRARSFRRRCTRSSAVAGRHSIGPTRPATSAGLPLLPSPAGARAIILLG